MDNKESKPTIDTCPGIENLLMWKIGRHNKYNDCVKEYGTEQIFFVELLFDIG